MSWIDDLTEGFIQQSANNVDPGFAKWLDRSVQKPLQSKLGPGNAIRERNNQIHAQERNKAYGQVFNQLTGGAAFNDLKLAAKNTLGNATPEQQQEFLAKTAGEVGLDFAGLAAGVIGPSYLARGVGALAGRARNVVQPLRQVGTELVEQFPEEFLRAGGPRPGMGGHISQPIMQRGPVQLSNILRLLGKKQAQELIQGRTATGQFSNLIPK